MKNSIFGRYLLFGVLLNILMFILYFNKWNLCSAWLRVKKLYKIIEEWYKNNTLLHCLFIQNLQHKENIVINDTNLILKILIYFYILSCRELVLNIFTFFSFVCMDISIRDEFVGVVFFKANFSCFSENSISSSLD